jgi:hypothetical protein
MNINESINLKGSVKVQLFDENMKLKQEHEDHNLIVTIGKTFLATWLATSAQSDAFAAYIALGTGSSGPTAGDTTLGSELTGGSNARVLGTLSSSSNTWNTLATFAPGNGTGTVTEAGLFHSSTAGTMFARQVFAAYNKAAGDTLIISWTVTLS